MEKYIITFEDGVHYVSNEISLKDMAEVDKGTLTIIRCSDLKELQSNGDWKKLPKWNITFP